MNRRQPIDDWKELIAVRQRESPVAFFGPPRPILVKGDDGEVLGPFWRYDYPSMHELAGITEHSPALTEGMPRWLTLREAIVWSLASLMTAQRDAIASMVQNCEAGQMNIKDLYNSVHSLIDCRWKSHDRQFFDAIMTALRLNLALVFHVRDYHFLAKNYASTEFPAMEFQAFSTTAKTRYWRTVWESEGGKFFEGRMIARRDSDIWERVSEFGFPCLPFSIDDNAKLLVVGREDAVRLGVVEENETFEMSQDLVYRPILF